MYGVEEVILSISKIGVTLRTLVSDIPHSYDLFFKRGNSCSILPGPLVNVSEVSFDIILQISNTHTHTHNHTYTHVRVYTDVYIYTYIYSYIYIYIYIYIDIYTFTHLYVYICIHIKIRRYICIYIYEDDCFYYYEK